MIRAKILVVFGLTAGRFAAVPGRAEVIGGVTGAFGNGNRAAGFRRPDAVLGNRLSGDLRDSTLDLPSHQ